MDALRRVAAVARALADPGRLRILRALRRGELCACHLSALLDLAPPTVTRHLVVLRGAGLVETRRRGRWLLCRLAADAPRGVREALAWALRAVGADAGARADDRRLRRIVRATPMAPCPRRGAR